MLRCVGICALIELAAAMPGAARTPPPALHFSTFATTDLPLGQVVWIGDRFLYNAENLGKLEVSDAAGRNFKDFATFDQGGEEMRCAASPSRPKLWPDGIYCHTPDNRILRIARDGSAITELARVPSANNSDGALAFDTVGRFRYALLAATGGSSVGGGQVFAIRQSGKVDVVGTYAGPGGAENIVVAPRHFGSASGAVLISIDEDTRSGRVLAMDTRGRVQTVASGLGNGVNPIGVIQAPFAERPPGSPAAGFYISDTISMNVFFTPAAALRPFAGSVIVGTELTGQFWLIRPKVGGFEALSVKTDLPAVAYNLEGATWVR